MSGQIVKFTTTQEQAIQTQAEAIATSAIDAQNDMPHSKIAVIPCAKDPSGNTLFYSSGIRVPQKISSVETTKKFADRIVNGITNDQHNPEDLNKLKMMSTFNLVKNLTVDIHQQ